MFLSREMTDHYVGRRLSLDGARCTVRYHGPVDGSQGDWYGVEWDDPRGRGKNDGSHKGVRYFKCKQPAESLLFFRLPFGGAFSVQVAPF